MIPIARLILAFVFFCAACTSLLVNDYFPPLARAVGGGISVLLLTTVEPRLITVLSERPLYVDEFACKSSEESALQRQRRLRAMRVFQRGVSISTAVGFALIVEWFALTHVHPTSAAQNVAVVGGILSATRRVHSLVSKTLLYWMHLYTRPRRGEDGTTSTREVEITVQQQ